MFFDKIEDIEKIAERAGTSIFVVPGALLDSGAVKNKNALVLKPEEKTTITVEQVRGMLDFLNVKATQPRYIMIVPAEKLGENAANALLKNLEEPKENYHFILLVENLSALLPTILSRAAVYFLRTQPDFETPPNADEKTKALAREMIAATPENLIVLAEKIAKTKEGAREKALAVLAVGVEILYKSFLKTGNSAFLKKIPKFLAAHENIAKNGHIKLHLVADMI